MADLKTIYQALTREEAEAQLATVAQTWSGCYAIAVRSWEQNWESLATCFDYPQKIRRLIYTTNAVEGYHRQLGQVTKTKGAFPTPEAARKLLYLVHMDVTRDWTAPMRSWPLVLNQVTILIQERLGACPSSLEHEI